VTWILQIPAAIMGALTVAFVVAISVGGLVVFRKIVPHTRLEGANEASGHVFQLAGVLYAVLVAFVVVVVWEQFNDAENAAGAEANAIADLLRDSAALPAASRPAVEHSLVAYTQDVIDDEFPRMRRGEAVEEQSGPTTDIWTAYLAVQPQTRNEIAFFDHDIAKLNELSANRKMRVSAGAASIPSELWVLLIGGGAVVMAFTFLFATRDLLVHACAVGLTAALMGFVIYLIFALEYPFVGALSVDPDQYSNVLQIWSHHVPQPS
jgi:Protein of unknown function (DUF4239)